jgi:hypothetical protein
MTRATRLFALVCLGSTLGLAQSWYGALVNSKCYDSLERNHSPDDALTSVDRDRHGEILYCAPNAKTKSFGVVLDDGSRLKFDPAGNAQAADFVRRTGKKPIFLVDVKGQVSHHTVSVSSISLAR